MNESTTDLCELALLAGHGDEEAFSRLAEHFLPALGAMVSRFTVSDADREDLVQEGLIGLYKATRLFDPALSSFATFARICMRSAVLDGVRKCGSATPLPSLEEMEEEVSAPDHLSPDRILMGKEELARLMQQVEETLSPMERRIFGLKLQGKRCEEIARLVAKDKKSVENTLYRLRKKLYSAQN